MLAIVDKPKVPATQEVAALEINLPAVQAGKESGYLSPLTGLELDDLVLVPDVIW